MIRRPPRSTQSRSSAASDVYKRQGEAHALHRVEELCELLLVISASAAVYEARQLLLGDNTILEGEVGRESLVQNYVSGSRLLETLGIGFVLLERLLFESLEATDLDLGVNAHDARVVSLQDFFGRREHTALSGLAPLVRSQVIGANDDVLGRRHDGVAVGRRQDVVRGQHEDCLLYTSDAADDLLCVDLGGRRIIKKKNK